MFSSMRPDNLKALHIMAVNLEFGTFVRRGVDMSFRARQPHYVCSIESTISSPSFRNELCKLANFVVTGNLSNSSYIM